MKAYIDMHIANIVFPIRITIEESSFEVLQEKAAEAVDEFIDLVGFSGFCADGFYKIPCGLSFFVFQADSKEYIRVIYET